MFIHSVFQLEVQGGITHPVLDFEKRMFFSDRQYFVNRWTNISLGLGENVIHIQVVNKTGEEVLGSYTLNIYRKKLTESERNLMDSVNELNTCVLKQVRGV